MISNQCSAVENTFLERESDPLRLEDEKIGVIVVDNFPALGRLTALRFLEWVQANPDGVISLPTGKTPEYFIRTVEHYLNTWKTKATRDVLGSCGMDSEKKPRMNSLHFVQIDEFYPMDPAQQNSFYYYVREYYIKGFGLDPKKALLIDCSRIGISGGHTLETLWPDGTVDLTLRYRHPASQLEYEQKNALEALDQWCVNYEEQIRDLGGIGFFLGGIGPDGHVAFNISGSDHNTTTRLTPTNYETQAAAATDLGGIEVAQKAHAITIGLSTITANPECTAIIMAAGEAKSEVVKDAVMRDPHIHYPGTALHKLKYARFYLTAGAAKDLPGRRLIRFKSNPISDYDAEKVVIDLSLKMKKAILDLTARDFKQDDFCSDLLLRDKRGLDAIKAETYDRLVDKLRPGSDAGGSTVFLHTAPHHDDIMLGYFPYVVRHIRDATNRHVFTYLTSGFTAVTNHYALEKVKNLRFFLKRPEFMALFDEGYFSTSGVHVWNRDVWQYLDGVAANDDHMKHEGEARRLLRNLIEVFEDQDIDNLEHRIDELLNYLCTQYAGKRDIAYVQALKGMIREWEADCLWGYMGFDKSSVHHLRLGFYQGRIFTEEPTYDRDVKPVVNLLKKVNPNVVTVAMDPEGSGPDTHYKVMQAVAEALRQYEKETGRSDITVIGYRNVWYRFHPAEADCFVPVSLNMFALLQSAFLDAFVSQKDASFPSYAFAGPFSGLAQKIQVEQYQMIKTCLGRRFFNDHERPLIRATRGFVFLKQLSLEAFYEAAREIRKTTEAL